MSEPAAVLFDMDGLLVDTEPVWTIAEVELCTSLGVEFTPEMKAAIVGTSMRSAVPTLLRLVGAPCGPEDVVRTMDWLLDRMVGLFAATPVALPGVVDLLDELAASAVPVALVSSSYRVLVDAVLAHGFGPFQVTLAGDEVDNAKPHPEPYLGAAARLGVDPTRCVVLEDSPAGVASAEAAGCAVVAVPSVPGVAFSTSPRRLVVPSLQGVGLAHLSDLLRRVA
jgi:HAD superfamily hydrolase (TIGR01509 family)